MATQIYSKGTWKVLNPRSWGWTQYASVMVQIQYTNDTGREVIINNLVVPLASGNGTVYGSNSGDPPYTPISGNGGSFDVKAVAGGVTYTGTVTGSIGVGSLGNVDRSGFFNEIPDNDTYRVTFTTTSPLKVSPGSSVTFNISKSSSGSNTILTVREPQITSASTLYSGKPATPSAPSSSNLNILSEKLYTPTVYLKDIVTSWSGATGCQYQSVTPSGTEAGWNYYSEGSRVNADLYSKIQFRLYNQTVNSDYENPYSDLSYSSIKTCTIKLNAPSTSYTTPSTGGYTIGESVTVTSSSSTNPSGLSYTIGYSTNSGTTQTGTYSGSSVGHTLTNNTTKFRSKVSKTGYVDSDYSSWTSPVSVYYEPRSMTSNGFTYSFKSDGSDITSSTIAIPEKSFSVSWSSFLSSKNLGRFNYYTISLIDTSNNSVLNSVSGENNPSVNSSESFSVNPEWAGKSCKLKLECLCYYSNSYYGPQSTAIFESPTFLIGGKPEVSLIYPSSLSFYSCNPRARLIFSVNNPDYFSDKKIVNTTVRVVSDSVSDFNYTLNKSYFMSTLSDKPDRIDNGTVVDFTIPPSILSDHSSGKIALKVKCSNDYMDSDWTDEIELNYINTAEGLSSSGYIDSSGYISSDRPLLESDMICIHDWTRDVLKGYSNFKSSAWEDADNNIPDKDSDSNYLVQKRPYYNRDGSIYLLKSVYDLVKVYSVPPESLRIDLDKINIYNLEPELVQASKPPFQESEDGKFIPTGNYFNYILYILKNML